MIDFTSSLYLGMKHESTAVGQWKRLTTGVPAALSEPSLSRQLGDMIARMQGLQEGVLAPSTLHLYQDLYGILRRQNITVFVDEHAYPVSRYGLDRLVMQGVGVFSYKHLDAGRLAEMVKRELKIHSNPVIITDGWCTLCGRPAPLKEYAKLAASLQGLVIVDDTQAFGILGEKPANGFYGKGGGGTLKWASASSESIVTIVSLAKGFGVPAAAISGNGSFISEYIYNSETRMYSSQVSNPHLLAVANALTMNRNTGDQRRALLRKNVLLLRQKLYQTGIRPQGGFFPFQYIDNLDPVSSSRIYDNLLAHGITAALVTNHHSFPVVCFLVRNDHRPDEFEYLGAVLQKCIPLQAGSDLLYPKSPASIF